MQISLTNLVSEQKFLWITNFKMRLVIYFISQLVRALLLVNLAGRTLLYGPLNLVAMQNVSLNPEM